MNPRDASLYCLLNNALDICQEELESKIPCLGPLSLSRVSTMIEEAIAELVKR